MKQNSNAPANSISRSGALAAIFIATIGYILLSPKWLVPVFAWIAPVTLLYFFRYAPFKFKLLWLFIVLYTATLIANYDVNPFPFTVLVIINIIGTITSVIPFLLDKWITKQTNKFGSTLVFPAAFVALEYINSTGMGGVWGSIANTQYSFAWLAQLASVTGLWGITFLVYWFASVVVWVANKKAVKQDYKTGAVAFSIILLIVIFFGAIRYSSDNTQAPETKVAGVTVPLFSFMAALYKDNFHREITIDPKVSQTSSQLQQVNLALIPFIENPDTIKFSNGYYALHKIYDSLFTLSTKAANEGAKIISWSEGNAFVLKSEEQQLLSRGTAFASTHHVYLLMAMATVLPGKIMPDKNFVENKAILIGPDGKILNDFRKNHPVPMAEHSKPGDGKIPVIKTPYGNISTSICYDADFPETMQQLSTNKTGLLLLPSGDWYSISPFHSYMASFRAIENGTSMFRQVSGGLSVAVDYRGKVYGQKNFFDAGDKFTIANIPVAHVATIYGVIGDSFAVVCMVYSALAIIYLLAKTIAVKRTQRIANKTKNKEVIEIV